MRAVGKMLLATLAVAALALVLGVGGPAASRSVERLPTAIGTTSYPWVQPPPGTGVTAPRGTVVQRVCAPVQLPCTIPLR